MCKRGSGCYRKGWEVMVFEIGKCYKHKTGEEIKVIGELETTLYGKALIAESGDSSLFSAVGRTEDCSVNWTEITEEEWMKNFS